MVKFETNANGLCVCVCVCVCVSRDTCIACELSVTSLRMRPAAGPHEGVTPLSAAARQGHVEVVTMLLSAKADVSKIDKNGRNALTRAAR